MCAVITQSALCLVEGPRKGRANELVLDPETWRLSIRYYLAIGLALKQRGNLSKGVCLLVENCVTLVAAEVVLGVSHREQDLNLRVKSIVVRMDPNNFCRQAGAFIK